jgi:starch synthase (maltosyl-transferring)
VPRAGVPAAGEPAFVVVESIEPCVDGGRFAAKGVAGEATTITADVFTHGHDLVRAWLRWRREGGRRWSEAPMAAEGNDRFAGVVIVEAPGSYEVEVVGDLDPLASWRRDARRRLDAGRPDPFDPATGAGLLRSAELQLPGAHAALIGALAARLEAASTSGPPSARDELGSVLDELDASSEVFDRRPVPAAPQAAMRTRILFARRRAAYSSWYELFPRSASDDPARSGTLRDVAARLGYVATLGFDVLYLPPVHPIGVTARKGRGNNPVSAPGDVGSPWAIGGAAGGHTAIAPELGTLDDFDHLLAEAAAHGIEVAMDLAFQCSPDHPWVQEHPAWFRHRPDGSIACAENPPKRYEDIYPIDFATVDREALWQALLGVTCFWADRGVRIFRVDNPHTKPFAFWEWMIAEARRTRPDLVFLSEAFTRPRVMHRLAKLGFDQSYTYFTWRDSKWELQEYFTELTRGPGRSYFRPNVWPNTPDILARSLQSGGRPSFVTRLVLAGGLSANYGIYGPAFELLWDRPAAPGSEEYLDSEKYEVHHHDLADPRGIGGFVAAVNAARRAHPALQHDRHLRFHHVDNDQLLCWSKRDDAGDDAVLCVVNLDPRWKQSGLVSLDLGELGVGGDEPFVVHDLLGGGAYQWKGPVNYVELNPAGTIAHLFEVLHP